jgi:DNA-binding NarL/FixJ family response regulator
VAAHPQPATPPGSARTGLQTIRVVLADDHALMRRGLRLVLDVEPDVEVVAEAGDLATVSLQVHRHLPGVLVIDLGMSNGSSLETIRALRQEVPSTEIVVLTMEDSWVFAAEVVEAGAVGFVLKQGADAELAPAVRRAARGERYLSPRLPARVAPVGR